MDLCFLLIGGGTLINLHYVGGGSKSAYRQCISCIGLDQMGSLSLFYKTLGSYHMESCSAVDEEMIIIFVSQALT